MTRRYITKNIRDLLTEGFDDEVLRRFCFDEPTFRPVFDQLSREMGKDLIIDRLIEHAYQNSRIDTLLSLLRNLNPARYKQHQPYEGELDLAWPEVAAYLDRVVEIYSFLPLEGSDHRIPLTDVFVMLQAAQTRPRRDVELTEQRREEMGLSEDAGERGSRGAEEQQKSFFARLGWGAKEQAQRETKPEPPPPPPVEVSEVLSKHPHLIILGEPGGGKTTLLRYIALCLATNQGEAKLDLTEKYLPVFLELRRLAPEETLEQLLLRELTTAPYHLPPQTIRDWLNEGRLMLLLDALDEAPLERQTHTREQVERFTTSPKWSQNRLILTSRIAAYREGSSLSSDRFAHYTLRPLTGAEDTKLFVLGWLRSLGVDEAKAEIEAEAKTIRLIEHMTKQPGLRRVMSNPLQLRLAIAAYYEGGRAALVNRAQLYRHYLEEALRRREQMRGVCPPWDRVMTGLERLAWARHTTPGGQLSQQQAIELLGKGGYERLNFLRQRTGLIVEIGQTEQGEPLLAFSHQTYQEYLVARVLSQDWQAGEKQQRTVWAILKPRLHHPDWREPILLLVGLLPPTETSHLLHRIHRARSPYEKVLHRDLLLALMCIGNSLAVNEAVSANIVTEAVSLWRAREVRWRFLVLSALISLLLTLPIAYPLIPWERPWLALLGSICLVPILVFVIYFAIYMLVMIWQHREVSWRYYLPIALISLLPTLPILYFLIPQAWLALFAGVSLAAILYPCVALIVIGLGYFFLSWLLLLFRRGFGHYAELNREILALLKETGHAQVATLLIAALNDKNEGVRQQVAEALGQLGDVRSVPPLINALNDKDRDVRRTAAEALGKLGDSRAVTPLIASLDDEIWYIRETVIKALGQLKDLHVVPTLITILLNHEDWIFRKTAAEILGELGDSRAVTPLITILLDDKDEYMHQPAAEALVKLGEAAMNPLIAALSNENKRVRWRNLARAFMKLGDARAVTPFILALGDNNKDVRQAAAYTLGQLRDIHMLSRFFFGVNENYRLGQLEATTMALLLTALDDEDKNVRQAAAYVLGQLGDTRAVERLLAALNDEDEGMRWGAAEALRRLGDIRTVIPFITALKDQSANVRFEAAEALGILKNTNAVVPLIATLRDKHAGVRWKAAEALGRLGDGRAVEPLILTMVDEYELTRQAAVNALGQLGDVRAVEPLSFALMKEPAASVRWRAAYALSKLGDVRAVDPLIAALKDENFSVREIAAYALGQLKDARAVAPLIAALNDEVKDVSQRVIEALVKLGDVAVAPLIATLKPKGWSTRRAVTETLRGKSWNDVWGEQYKDWSTRGAAAEVLGKLGDTRAMEPLLATLHYNKRSSDSSYYYWEQVGATTTKALAALALKLTEPQCRIIARRLWQEAISPDKPDVYEPLLSVANRLVVLEVERLPPPEYPNV